MSPEGVAEGVAWSVAQGVPERVVWCWWQRLIAELVGLREVSHGVSLVSFDRGCGWEVLRRVSLRVSHGVSVVVLDRRIVWEVSRKLSDHGCGWKVLRRVSAWAALVVVLAGA